MGVGSKLVEFVWFLKGHGTYVLSACVCGIRDCA